MMPTKSERQTSHPSSTNRILSSLVVVCLLITNGSAFNTKTAISSAATATLSARNVGITLWSSMMNDEENFRRTPSEPFEIPSPPLASSEEESLSPTHPDNRNNGLDPHPPNILERLRDEIPFIHLLTGAGRKKLPPLQVDDVNVLLYDVFLIVNLALSISFWVTHRTDLAFLPIALNEGCLFSILWILSGLYHGSFLYSAMDGHYPPDDPSGRGGPKEAAALAFNTFINAINLRLVAALLGAWLQHRKVGLDDGMEQLIPLEISCGIVLMTMWRALHSAYTARV